MLSLFAFYVIATCYRPSSRELSGVIALTILGGCVAALYASMQFYSGTAFHGSSLRGSLIIGDRQTDPNVFAASLLLPSSLAIGEFLSCKNRLRSYVLLCAIVIINLAIFLSMSRGALFSLA